MSVRHTEAEWFAKVNLASNAWGTWGRILCRWPQPLPHQPIEDIPSKYHIPYTMPKLLLPLKGLLKELLKRSSPPLLSKVSFHSLKVHKMLLSDKEKAPCRGLAFSTLPHIPTPSWSISLCSSALLGSQTGSISKSQKLAGKSSQTPLSPALCALSA